MSWRSQFSSDYCVPQAILDLVEVGRLKDVSCQIDPCPSFQFHDMTLWVDAENESRRITPHSPRFIISYYAHETRHDIFLTDDLQELIQFLHRT